MKVSHHHSNNLDKTIIELSLTHLAEGFLFSLIKISSPLLSVRFFIIVWQKIYQNKFCHEYGNLRCFKVDYFRPMDILVAINLLRSYIRTHCKAYFSKICRIIHTMIPHPSLALNAFTLSECTFTCMSC